MNNGKEQYFPTVHVDRYGAVNVIYYDDRHTTSDSAGVTLARSTDGGNTWIEYELSDHNFKPTPIGGLGQGYQGDNIDITSTDSTLWPVWMDNSTGIYQIWTAPVKFSIIQAIKDQQPEFDFQLYPNPVVSGSRFKVQSSRSGKVTLKLFSLLGAEVLTVFQGELNKGEHVFDLKPEMLNQGLGMIPGVYLARLTVNGVSKTIKLIYL